MKKLSGGLESTLESIMANYATRVNMNHKICRKDLWGNMVVYAKVNDEFVQSVINEKGKFIEHYITEEGIVYMPIGWISPDGLNELRDFLIWTKKLRDFVNDNFPEELV